MLSNPTKYVLPDSEHKQFLGILCPTIHNLTIMLAMQLILIPSTQHQNGELFMELAIKITKMLHN